MQLSELIAALEEIAPVGLAEPWDNVGLLVGDPGQSIGKVLLTIDYTEAVAAEARENGCDVIVAYHPPIFEPLKRLTGGSLVFDAIRRGVAIYSPHTALDVAEGGTNDVLADALGLKDRQPLRASQAAGTHYKLVTFVPLTAVEQVSAALFAPGAGRIGDYSSCSFRTAGTGTFFGEAGTKPVIGQSGRLETVEEIRLETVVPIGQVDSVIRALRQAHPYEEPAFDLNLLAAAPAGLGLGRIGMLPKVSRREIFGRIKKELGLSHLLIAGPTEGTISIAAVGAGAGGELLKSAIAQKVELYLTGEIRHHDAIQAARAGMTVVCTLHSNSERAVLKRLKQRLESAIPSLPVLTSRQDRDPFSVT